MQTIPLTYMSGAGNLFTVIDNREHSLASTTVSALCPQLIQPTAAQSTATEGVLVVNSADDLGGIDVDFYNPDGSSSMMCGNGGRCAVRFAREIGALPASRTNGVLRMAGREYPFEISDDHISLTFGAPVALDSARVLTLDAASIRGSYVDVGSDHLVFERSEWERAFGPWSMEAFLAVAPSLRSHPSLPRGANVTVYEQVGAGILRLSTFERGVERVTYACGTGALATSVVAWMKSGGVVRTWQCIPPSGEVLHCEVCCEAESPSENPSENVIRSLVLSGPARILSHGSLVVSK
jgi:diaminopimelate epimerase